MDQNLGGYCTNVHNMHYHDTHSFFVKDDKNFFPNEWPPLKQLGHSIRLSKDRFPITRTDVNAVVILMSPVRVFLSPSDPNESLTVLVPSLQIEGTERCCRSARAVDLATFCSLLS